MRTFSKARVLLQVLAILIGMCFAQSALASTWPDYQENFRNLNPQTTPDKIFAGSCYQTAPGVTRCVETGDTVWKLWSERSSPPVPASVFVSPVIEENVAPSTHPNEVRRNEPPWVLLVCLLTLISLGLGVRLLFLKKEVAIARSAYANMVSREETARAMFERQLEVSAYLRENQKSLKLEFDTERFSARTALAELLKKLQASRDSAKVARRELQRAREDIVDLEQTLLGQPTALANTGLPKLGSGMRILFSPDVIGRRKKDHLPLKISRFSLSDDALALHVHVKTPWKEEECIGSINLRTGDMEYVPRNVLAVLHQRPDLNVYGWTRPSTMKPVAWLRGEGVRVEQMLL